MRLRLPARAGKQNMDSYHVYEIAVLRKYAETQIEDGILTEIKNNEISDIKTAVRNKRIQVNLREGTLS